MLCPASPATGGRIHGHSFLDNNKYKPNDNRTAERRERSDKFYDYINSSSYNVLYYSMYFVNDNRFILLLQQVESVPYVVFFFTTLLSLLFYHTVITTFVSTVYSITLYLIYYVFINYRSVLVL